jgi:hypothetical protein
MCILMQNKNIEKLYKPLLKMQDFVNGVFNSVENSRSATNVGRCILVLNFLSVAL